MRLCAADAYLLTAGVLELGTTQCLDHLRLVLVRGSHRHNRLTNVDTSHGALRLAEGATHSSLQPISAGARQHLVDADDVEGMHTHTDVEGVLSAMLHKVLVAANAAGLQSLRAQLFQLVRHQVHAQREVLDGRALTAQIEDADLGIRDTTAEPRLRVRLVFAIPITVRKTQTISFRYFAYRRQRCFCVWWWCRTQIENNILSRAILTH